MHILYRGKTSLFPFKHLCKSKAALTCHAELVSASPAFKEMEIFKRISNEYFFYFKLMM